MSFSGSSMQEARELYRLLQESMNLTVKLERKTVNVKPSFDALLATASGLFRIMNRMGLLGETEAKLHYLIMQVHLLTRALWTLQSTTIYGQVLTALGTTMTIIEMTSTLGELFGSLRGNRI